MAPPSDRTVRTLRRSFTQIKLDIKNLLKQKITSEVMVQIEILNDGSLKPTWEKFENAAMELFLLVDEKEEEDLAIEKKVMQEQSELRLTFSAIQARIKSVATQLKGEEMRRSIIPTANSTVIEAGSVRSLAADQPKLKKIDIPEFDGDLSKFFNFKALFVNLVHNNSDFSNVQKLFYLKQALVGKAAIVLQDCDLAEDAYPEAWSYFLDRYESKRAIVKNYFVKLSALQPIKSESGIREILDQTMAIIRGLKVAGESVNETFSRFIAFQVTNKLDSTTAKDWENHTCQASTYPKFEELFKFLQGRTFVIDDRRFEKPRETKEVQQKSTFQKKSFLASTSSKGKCPLCRSQHYLNQCETFKAMNAHRRFDFVKEARLCLICFSKDHSSSSCNSNFKCRCGQPHHNLLHFDFKNGSSKSNEVVNSNEKKTVESDGGAEKDSGSKKVYTNVVHQEEKVVLLPSAVVGFQSGNAQGTIRMLGDNCAQATMVTDRLVKKHRIETFESSAGSLIGGVTPGVVSANRFVRLLLISRCKKFEIEIEAEVVPPASMAYNVFTEVSKETLEKLSKFQLAHPALSRRLIKVSDVDLILGAEYFEKCLEEKMMEVNGLFLRSTKFGWTVSGPIVKRNESSKKFAGLTLKTIGNDLKKFYEVESVESKENIAKKESDRCVEHFERTVRVWTDGKFCLRLPLKRDKSKIAKNRRLALISLYRMEQKLDPGLKLEYVKFMREYVELGHASPALPTNEPCYYIPHRAVVREDSLTTPVRVVFNASSHEKGQISLNAALMIGPQIQRELFDILISVRSYCFVFSADIEKMYRMIWIDDQDRDLQRILWRESPQDPVREFCLNTVTYGTGPASFLATQCLEVIAREIEKDHPEASRMIRENFYMDDLIAGGDDQQQVKSNLMIVHNVLSAHGFNLRKYSANSQQILSDIPANLVLNGSNVELAENVAMLGIVWSPPVDGFCVKLNLKIDEIAEVTTKRLMLSLLARTFDPLGLIAPVCLRGKLMIQSLWREGLDWDVQVPHEVAVEFREYLQDLSKLNSFVVPRYVCRPQMERQIVGFCDASARAYCAAVFVRTIGDGKVRSCQLICAKTRVAPTKELTIPKLELSAALLLAQLTDRVRRNLKINRENCFLFTDATIVLCWLSQSAEEWRTFVSHRVQKIQSLIPYSQWFYINTSNNPADLATRGLSVAEFLDSKMWFHGPDCLKNPDIHSDPIPNLDVSEALEKRKRKVCVSQVVKLDNFIDRFSSFYKLLRILAYVVRFRDRTRGKLVARSLVVSAVELENALTLAIRMVQQSHFFEDIARLSNDKALKASSKLLALNPFLDENWLLRVGGRLKQANVSQFRKHPVILPARSHLVRVMLSWIHERYFHANRKFLMGYMAARYWLVGGCSNSVKAVVRGCVKCARHRGETMSQLMGQLPAFRVNVSRPFTHTGVDLAGPFTCKCVAHRSTRHYKIYMAVFVCMTVKCVHLEIVTDLSSAKFVEALQRFIARRGAPAKIYSDNGTNFVGARNLIVFNQSDIENFSASEGIQWSMIPARSPHFGGIWESAVRSAKYHLVRVMDGCVFSYDEYLTLFARIESILNSRPLCLSVEQGDDVITPSHFLVGQSLTSPPELECNDSSIPLSRKLSILHDRVRSFWKVWRSDYLNQLQKRYKWQRSSPNLRVGQIVLVKDELPPCQWPLAVVQKVCPDSDGVVRVAELKLANSSTFLKRSIVKLVLLPVDVPPEPFVGSVGGVC